MNAESNAAKSTPLLLNVVGEAENIPDAVNALTRLAPNAVLFDLGVDVDQALEVLCELVGRGRTPRTLFISGQLSAPLRSGSTIGVLLKGNPGQGEVESTDAQRRLGLLSMRERQVLEEVMRGQSSKEIGTLLELSPKTVDTYRSRIMQKLGVGDLVTLVRFAIRHGVVAAA